MAPIVYLCSQMHQVTNRPEGYILVFSQFYDMFIMNDADHDSTRPNEQQFNIVESFLVGLYTLGGISLS